MANNEYWMNRNHTFFHIATKNVKKNFKPDATRKYSEIIFVHTQQSIVFFFLLFWFFGLHFFFLDFCVHCEEQF